MIIIIFHDWQDAEMRNYQVYEEEWIKKHGKHPCQCPEAVFVITQNPKVVKMTTLAVDNAFPSFLHSGTPRYYSPFFRRWLTSAEKFVVSGFPMRH